MVPSSIYKHMFDHAPCGMVLLSMDGQILETNKMFCEALKYESCDLLEKDFNDLIYKKDVNRKLSNNIKDLFESGKVEASNIILLPKDNNKKEFHYRHSIFHSEECGSVIILQIVDYINELEVESVLKEESGLFDALINSFPNEIFIKNKESKFLKVNKANLDKLKQPSLESVIGKSDFDFFDKVHAEKAYNDEQKIISTGEPILNFEEKEYFPDGRIAYINTSKLPLINKKGEIIGTFGVSQDITSRKLYELQLKEKTSILSAITAKMPIVIFKYKKEQGIISTIGDGEVKRAFENSRMAKLKVSDSLKHFVEKFGSQKDKNGYFNFSTTSRINKKEKYFENFIFKSHSDDEEYIGLALDDTERKITEQKLKKDARNMEKINKELNQFAYIISHDLKAPLRAITNLSEWIEEDLSDYENPEVKEQLQLLRGRVSRMENLINGILKYSRLTRAELVYEYVDVEKVLEEIEDVLLINSSFKLNKPQHLPPIKFSKIHLEQIFTNLISNSVKHHDKQEGIINIEYHEVNGMHQFMIGDDGPGIAPEFHQKIFQIFQTLKARDSMESTGIGLTIVKKIVEEQGGEVIVDSNEGSGCRMYFTLPKTK